MCSGRGSRLSDLLLLLLLLSLQLFFGRGVGFFCQHCVFKSFLQEILGQQTCENDCEKYCVFKIMGQACEKEAIKEPEKKPLKV